MAQVSLKSLNLNSRSLKFFLLVITELFNSQGHATAFNFEDGNLRVKAEEGKPIEIGALGSGWDYKKTGASTHTFINKERVTSELTTEEKFVFNYVAGSPSTMANIMTYNYKDGSKKFYVTSTDFDEYIQYCSSETHPSKGKLDCNLITPEVCSAYQVGYSKMTDEEKLKCQSVIDIVRMRKIEAVKKYATKAANTAKIATGTTLGPISYNQGFDPLYDAANCFKLAKNKGLPMELYHFKPIADGDQQTIYKLRNPPDKAPVNQ